MELERLGDPSLEMMTGCDLGAYAADLLNHLEKSRVTSRAFTKGTLQSELKKGYEKLGKVINTFVAKIEARGDAAFYKHQLDLYKDECNKIKEENYRLKQEIDQLKKEFYEFKNTYVLTQRTVKKPLDSSSSPSIERVEVIPDISYFVNRENWKQRENAKNLPALSKKEFPPLPTKPSSNQGKTTRTPNPIRRPPQLKADTELNRINQQITALKVARSKILKRTKGNMENQTWGNQNKQQESTPDQRRGPRIVEDVTILPPRDLPPPPLCPDESDGEWIKVNKKRSRSNPRKKKNTETNTNEKGQGYTKKDNRQFSRKRLPRSAAISIKASKGVSYAEALRKIKQETTLSDYGINNIRIRKAANKNTLLEISGIDHANKANALADKIQEVLGSMAKVTRPTRRADLRILGFDESVMPEEIECAVFKIGNRKIDKVKVGRITCIRNGQGIVTVNCPLSAAINVSNIGKIKIKWTISRVTLLKPRPLQCYKCWHYGHASYNCRSQTNRTGACFNCCSTKHKIQTCKATPNCAVCQEQEFPHDHRIGSGSCKSKLLGNRNPADRKTADKTQN